MAPGDWLRGLQMRKARHHPISPRARLLQKCLHQRLDTCDGPIGLIADPKAKVSRHLVIAAAARVQTPRRLTNDLLQTLLNIHMNIFQIHPKWKIPRVNF